MQRRASKSTRGVNAAEKRFCAWVKEQPCVTCRAPGPSIADHVLGSSAKIKFEYVSVLVGPWILLSFCQRCDSVKTLGSHRAFIDKFGQHQVDYWFDFVEGYDVPDNVIRAMESQWVRGAA